MAIPTLTVTSSAASSTLLGVDNGDAYSRIVAIANTDANALCIRIGSAATTSAYNVRIVQNGFWESPVPIQGDIYGIWEADGAGAALVTEY